MTGVDLKNIFKGRWFGPRVLYPILAGLLVLPPSANAQIAAASPQNPPTPQADTIRSLKVVPLAGNMEMNDLESKVMAPLVVQVRDQSDQPVEGVDVVFRFPLEGPGATFPGHKNSQTVRTNADGQAAATGWMANGKVGTFQIQVTASRGNEQGVTSISMLNVTRIAGEARAARKKWWSTRLGKIAIIAGAAGIATAVILATRGSGSNAPAVVTGLPGSPSIGGPQ